MSYVQDYVQYPRAVVEETPQVRADFIRKTYLHVAGALAAFVLLEVALFQTGVPEAMIQLLVASKFSWLIVLGGFMGVTFVAQRMADNSASQGAQYGGLALYTVAEALIFAPILLIAAKYSNPTVLPSAVIVTLALFGGLTAAAFITKTDFSFLGPIIAIGGFIALGVVIASMVIGFSLGTIFASIMVLFAACCILYDTSKIMYKYGTHQHVAAALSLFASIMLLFWYILRLFMSRD